MSRVMLAQRKMFLHMQLSYFNKIALDLSQKLHELHKYSASVAKGFVSPLAMAGMPRSCMGLAIGLAYGQFKVNNDALRKSAIIWGNQHGNPAMGMSAIDAANQFGSTIREMLENPNAYNQKIASIPDEQARNNEIMKNEYMFHLFKEAQKEEQRELAKQKQQEIKVIEDDITMQQQLNNTRLEVTKTELKQVEEAEKAAIDRSKSVYA